MNHKLEKMQKELNQMKEKSNNNKNVRALNQISNTIQQVQQSALTDKPMTMEEKTNLKNSIGLITPEQQRGIISIVSDCISQNNNEIFEFELD